MQGGRSWGNAGMALPKRLGLLRKEGAPTHAILSSKAFKELSKKVIILSEANSLLESFQRKSSYFWKVFHESHFAFREGELSTKI